MSRTLVDMSWSLPLQNTANRSFWALECMIIQATLFLELEVQDGARRSLPRGRRSLLPLSRATLQLRTRYTAWISAN